MSITIAPDDEFTDIKSKYAEDLPDMSDQDLLTEMRIVMIGCEPCGRVPSSARMRRILRTAIKLMEDRMPKEEFSGQVGKNYAFIEFKRNEHIQHAFEELEKHIPKKWDDRGLLKFWLLPIDMSYGDGGNGFVGVKWIVNSPSLHDKTDKTGQCTIVEALNSMVSSNLTAMELACPAGAERVNVELKITSRKPL